MKNLMLPLLIFSLLLMGCDQDDVDEVNDDTDDANNGESHCGFIDFKYYNDTEHSLGEMSEDYILIGVDTINEDSEIQDFISNINQFDQSYDYTIHTNEQYKFKQIVLKFNASKNCEEITQTIADLEEHEIVDYAHYTMQTDNCEDLIGESMGDKCVKTYGSSFNVKVFDEDDLSDLNQMIEETNTELVDQNEYRPEWFELRATKHADGDALAMANFFHESGLFEHSEPQIGKYPVE